MLMLKNRLIQLLVVFCLLVSNVYALPNKTESEHGVFIGMQNFSWQLSYSNFDYSDSGMMFTGGFYWYDSTPSYMINMNFTIFSGDLDSDDEILPEKSYTGFDMDLDIGKRFYFEKSNKFLENFVLTPFLGIGVGYWGSDAFRFISDINQSYSYDRTWWNVYAKAGILKEYYFSKNSKIFVKAGISYPIYAKTSLEYVVKELGVENKLETTLNPGGQISLLAEAGIKVSAFTFQVFYENWKFSETKEDNAYLPESKNTFVGGLIKIKLPSWLPFL